jgi:hypothetical protein
MLNIIEANELEYQKRRRLVEEALQEEDYEPFMTDVEFPGETAEEYYSKHLLNECREDINE